MVLLAGLLVGCGSSARITDAWIDPALEQRRLDGVMVIAVAGEAPDHHQLRVGFETAMAAALEQQGVRAVASHTLIPEHPKRARVIAAAKANSLAAVLVTQYAGTLEQPVYHPGTDYYTVVPLYDASTGRDVGWGWGQWINVYSDPAVWTSNNRVTLISDLYRVEGEKRVWQAVSTDMETGSVDQLQQDFIRAFVDEILKQELLAH
ncbi:DUF4136 domain-containing protein [Aestuariirhabdus litorea]|uniref:DUF4136 domain-containing protein n=2 Tax=Aestuariirhabdus litorea TaxID=2528527 RepID=A0A3P3VI67_9GAMM|nr:DUF4136 domain-containing protein [Aestuariirhabdus litorea]